jgi:hypothetical protein
MNRLITVLSFRPLLMLGGGGLVGTFVAFGLYTTKVAYFLLLPLVVAVALGATLFRNFRLYWFALFLLSMQLPIAKNLNDGYEIIRNLKIDYVIWNFTFQITVTDLVLLILLAIWFNDHQFHGKLLRFPRVAWLAVGYLGACLLSLIATPSPYLGLVQISLELKYFIVFLFAVNCLDTKDAVRVLILVGAAILVVQAATTVMRFETGYITALAVGDAGQDLDKIQKYLAVDRSASDSSVRGFGTLVGPGSTTRLCMMFIPLVLFLSARNAMFGRPWAFAAISAFVVSGLVLTFTRVYYIIVAAQCALVFLFMVRNGALKLRELVVIGLLATVALAAVAPKVYEQFTIRTDSASIRFLQYEAAAKMFLDYPVLGIGLNNGNGEKPRYSTLTYSRSDPATQFHLEPTHNMYLSMASEIGFVGTSLFLAFFGTIAVSAFRRSRLSPDREVRLMACMFFVVFCSVFINGLMDPWQDYSAVMLMWLYAGITLNLPRMESST